MLAETFIVLATVFLIFGAFCFYQLVKHKRMFFPGVICCSLSVVMVRCADKIVDGHMIFVNPHIPLSYMVLGAS